MPRADFCFRGSERDHSFGGLHGSDAHRNCNSFITGARTAIFSGGRKNTEVLMARIDDYCKRHPLDNLYNPSAALVDELRQRTECGHEV
jgi:hypothetical protein